MTFGTDYVRAIAPYQPGKPISEVAREYGLDPAKIVKLASNENPLGMSDAARTAIADAIADCARYPDGNAYAFKQALARHYGVNAEWITGSNDILMLAAQALVALGQGVVYSQHAFEVYPLAAQANNARAVEVPAKDYGHDLDAMLAAIDADTRLVFVANPNNPTGTFHAGDALLAFLERVPSHVVVLDEAYSEYLAPALRYDAFQWVARFPNLIVVRTFSKIHGLAGLRVGFGVAQPELTGLLNRVRQPLNVCHPAQAAAIAALSATDFVERSRTTNVQGYRQLTEGFEKLGLRFVPSHGNFVLVEVGMDDAAGARVTEALLRRGVIVRPVAGYRLPRWVHITIGTEVENAACLTALASSLSA